MRQERTVQATIFEVFAGHQIGRELKAISDWLDGQHALLSLVASDLRREGVRPTGRRGLPAETVLRCALLKQQLQLSYEELYPPDLILTHRGDSIGAVWRVADVVVW